MTRTIRTVLVVVGVACFAVAGAAAAGWVPDPDPLACGLFGLGFWLASTAP